MALNVRHNSRTAGGWRNHTWSRNAAGVGGILKKSDKPCKYWGQGICKYGEKCRFLHSWFKGDSFSLLSELQGHDDIVTGITLPSAFDKLYTGCKDGTVKVWDCKSGQNIGVCNMENEIRCMLSSGPWVFLGLKNMVKAWNSQTNAVLSLDGPVGRVYTLVEGYGMLLAGVEDGSILAWKFDEGTNSFEPAAVLKDHTRAVVTLVVGANRLYSGSMDNSIRMWNLDSFECMQTLTEHTDVITSVLCWEQFLLSCSLDKTVKVWAATENGNLEVIYTHREQHGLLTMYGIHDLAEKPVLFCSCNDDSVRLYDLPSFAERGKIFSKTQIRTIRDGPGGIFFTGEGNGLVRVWKWGK